MGCFLIDEVCISSRSSSSNGLALRRRGLRGGGCLVDFFVVFFTKHLWLRKLKHFCLSLGNFNVFF